MILVPVEPLLQMTVPLQPSAVNTAVSLLHNLSLVVAIVGVVGLGKKLITIGVEAVLLPQLVVHVAV